VRGTLTSQHATASCRKLKQLAAHGRSEAFRRSCRQRGETAGIRTAYLKLTLQSCSLERCHVSFVSNPPSFLLPSVVAEEQGGDGGESVNGTNRTSDSIINDKLFGGGG
jgi:hypothetical protein